MALTRDISVSTALLAALFVWSLPALSAADDGEDRATLQGRYASKAGRFFVHAGAETLIRDDFYRSPGIGLDAGYFFDENLGLELRGRRHFTSLSHTGEQMARDHQLVPDMRAPEATVAAGARLSWGYGKVLTLGNFVVHFDPQLVAHGGLTFAEERFVPTASAGVGFLSHWKYGFQVKLDLQATLHFERRDRGVVVATGFAPLLSVGWSPGMEDSP